MEGSGKSGRGIQSDEKVLDIILALKRLDGAGVTELSDEINIAKSTAHGHLQTLLDYSFVVKEEGQYRLGLRFLDLGETARVRRDEARQAEEKVQELAERTKERSQYIVPEHGEGVYLYRASGPRAVQTPSRTGKRFPLHASAAGKAILSQFPEEELSDVIQQSGLPGQTENTITEEGELRDELATIRERGFAFNSEEWTLGLRAVAVPVTNPNNEVMGALSVSGPTQRMKGEWFREEIPEMILGAVNEIELDLEFS